MAIFDQESLAYLKKAIETLENGFADLPAFSSTPEDGQSLDSVLQEVALRLQDNYPYFHPLYAGQMMCPPHPVARLAYALAMFINPNNHALDGGRASSAMEKEAVAALAAMFGWKTHLGHLTSGGTMANLEALWVAGRLRPGKKIVASTQAHYTHERIGGVLGLEFEAIPCDRLGRMDATALEKRLERGDIGTVVGTVGTTAIGAVDPIHAILELRKRFDFRLHVDAAYGGYFTLLDNLTPSTRAAFDVLGEVDSLVVDPHKHGLQPYGCGAVLFRDPSVGQLYKHNSPYTYFSSKELHLGEISLECSRPGAAAVGLWATQKLLPMMRGGKFAAMLEKSRAAALRWHEKLAADPRFLVAFPPELDIVFWAARAESTGAISELSRKIFHAAAEKNLHLALANLPAAFFDLDAAKIRRDGETITCFRSVFMKPEHLDWIETLWKYFDGVCRDVL